jgi:integrase
MKTALTDRAIKSAKKDLADSVVPGFILRVRETGAKSFALVARFPGSSNPTRRTIAPVGKMSLADARQTARDWIALLQQGRDPADELQRVRSENDRKRKDTIAAVAETYLARQVIGHMRTEQLVVNNFRDILIPLFGDRPIAELTSREVSLALAEIEKLGTDHGMVKLRKRSQLRRPNRPSQPSPVQARMLFVYLDGMLRWAAGTGDYGIDLSPLMRVNKAQRFGPKVVRARVLSDIEIAAAWRAMGTLQTPYRQFYRMLFLTGLRKGEVLEAQWDEFDPKLTAWTIPAKRMKGRDGMTAQEHVVPITSHMRAVLRELSRGNRGAFVFSLNGGKSSIAYRGAEKQWLDDAVLQDMGLPDSALDDPQSPIQRFTNHDLRRTLRTRGRKLGIASDVGEAMLAHRRVGIAGVYDHDDRLDERRAAHELWGDFLVKLSGERKVVRLRKAA